MRAAVLVFATACRMGFEPIETEQQVGTGVDAAAGAQQDAAVAVPDGAPLGTPCNMRIASTDNAYLPAAQCFAELDAARGQCNADPACVLTGWYWGPDTGVNDT